MAPTIRIDDEVYSWLQRQAVPFDDNPNSVLRRVAGLDQREENFNPEKSGEYLGSSRNKDGANKPQKGKRRPAARGEDLIKRWKIPVREARFHRDGTFYQHVTRFPAALCDMEGFVIFNSQDELESSVYIKIGEKLNVYKGISSIPNYQKSSKPIKD